MRCCYKAVNCFQNPHNRHPIAHPWGQGTEECGVSGVILMGLLPRGFYTICDVRQHDASDTIDKVKGKSTGAFTPDHRTRSPHATSKLVAEPFGRASSCDRELHRNGKHEFWQLNSGRSCISGICHQSYQCFGMLNASDGAQDILLCKKTNASSRKQILISDSLSASVVCNILRN